MANYWELKESDFPDGEPALKQKRGLWYRPHNGGYTSDVAEAGLYTREEVIQDCFHNNRNGYCDVLAIPIRMVMSDYTIEELDTRIRQLAELKQYTPGWKENPSTPED